ncbi:gamma-glutamylcyclotransferase family protein [Nonomuraea sp. NPDC003214]
MTLLVVITGTSLGNGFPFYSSKEYELTESLLLGHFQEIEVKHKDKPRAWTGWENFELNSEVFIFGYASLSSPASVEATLGHSVDGTKFCYAKLQGWARSWCVGSDKSSHPERTYFRSDGLEYTGVTVVLGIEPRMYDECDGTVFPVLRDDLSLLDMRERNYERIDVSEDVTWAGKPKNCRVYTYAPLKAATARITEAIKSGREVNIRQGYVRLVREAFAKYDQGGKPREWETLPYKLEEMRIHIDPSAAPQQVIIGSSSYLQSPPDDRNLEEDSPSG